MDTPSLTMVVLESVYEALGTITLPDYPATTFRGAFGEGLRARTCLSGLDDCSVCSLESRCSYFQIWEQPAAPAETPIRYATAPKPYVVEHHPEDEGRTVRPSEFTTLRIKLFGRGIAQIPYVLLALHDLGWCGLGRGGGRMLLREVVAHGPDGSVCVLFDNDCGVTGLDAPRWSLSIANRERSGDVRLRFVTPLALKAKGRLLDRFDPETFTARLLDRFELMSLVHEGRLIQWDHRRFRDWARQARVVGGEVKSTRFKRVSCRSGRVPMEGIVGDLILTGVHRDLMGLWQIAEHLHVGKQATFGFGRVLVDHVRATC